MRVSPHQNGFCNAEFKGGAEYLGNIRDFFSELSRTHNEDILAVDQDSAGNVLQQTLKGFDQGAFSRPVFPEDRYEFALSQRKRYVVDNVSVFISCGDGIDFQNCHFKNEFFELHNEF